MTRPGVRGPAHTPPPVSKTVRVLVALCASAWSACPSAAAAAPAPREGATHAVPLHGELLRPYDAPEDPYAPGHRGIDVVAPAGALVRASAAGAVSFAGSVAGNRTVTVDHGAGLVSSYSYLGSALVTKGAPVERGTPLGTVGAGHPGSQGPAHVHLSARRGGVYLDPAGLYVGRSYADLLALIG